MLLLVDAWAVHLPYRLHLFVLTTSFSPSLPPPTPLPSFLSTPTRRLQATYWRYHGEHERELECLMRSQQWNEAHAVLLNHVLPPVLLAGELRGEEGREMRGRKGVYE